MKNYSYKVVGVTFPARDGSDRQKNLSELFRQVLQTESYFRHGMHNVRFEGYDYQGAEALAVIVNDKEIGNIAANEVRDVAEIAQKAYKCEVRFGVNGKDIEQVEEIIDRHSHQKDYLEIDPFFDAEQAEEDYNAFMEEMKTEQIYSAVLVFSIMEQEDVERQEQRRAQVESEEKKKQSRRKPSRTSWKITFVLSIVLIVLGLILTIAVPVAGILAIIVGVVMAAKSRKEIKGTTGQDKK